MTKDLLAAAQRQADMARQGISETRDAYQSGDMAGLLARRAEEAHQALQEWRREHQPPTDGKQRAE